MEIRRSATQILTTLALNDQNKVRIVAEGGLEPLIRLTKEAVIECQRDATHTLCRLATHAQNKMKMVEQGVLPRLVELAQAESNEIQRLARHITYTSTAPALDPTRPFPVSRYSLESASSARSARTRLFTASVGSGVRYLYTVRVFNTGLCDSARRSLARLTCRRPPWA